ncbi:MAG: hypothetical protein JWO65_1715 [Sphingomonas bacterium]|jgi:hypothetical protein|nr:hypothetical protein [Sphingomonas bacterium]
MSGTQSSIPIAEVLARIADRASELTGVSSTEIMSELEHGEEHPELPHPGGGNPAITNRIVSVQLRQAVEQAIAEIDQQQSPSETSGR